MEEGLICLRRKILISSATLPWIDLRELPCVLLEMVSEQLFLANLRGMLRITLIEGLPDDVLELDPRVGSLLLHNHEGTCQWWRPPLERLTTLLFFFCKWLA